MSWFTLQAAAPNWPEEVPTFAPTGPLAPLPQTPPRDAGLKQWIAYWRSAGIHVDRCGCPDLLGQLERFGRQPIEAVICSALDGDSSLRLNAAVAARFADQVVAGVELLRRLTGASKSWIAMEIGAPLSWRGPIEKAVRQTQCAIVELANDYPQGDPTILIYTLTGRRLPPGHLPVEQGIILLDAPAALAIATGRGLVSMAVLDHRRHIAVFLDTPIGTPLREVLTSAGIQPNAKIFGGDWPRQREVDPNMPAGTGELTLHVAPPTQAPDPQPCIRCGWCVEVCPTLAHPALLLEAAQKRNPRKAKRAGLSACIECGVCDVICPSHLPILAGIRQIKAIY